MSKSQKINGLPNIRRSKSSGNDSNLPTAAAISVSVSAAAAAATTTSANHSITATITSTPTSSASLGVGSGVSAVVQCTPNASVKDHLGVSRLSTGGNASSAPGPGGTSSSPDVEAMREWW